MELAVYIQGERLDLFKDENIEINSSVKNLSDISKVFAEFTQSFTVPATPRNNAIFTHWYDAAVDGSFNANVRVEAYLEVSSLPFRWGSVQLESCKRRKGEPYAYSMTFYANTVNLSDLFGEEELDALDLSAYDHTYDAATVLGAMKNPTIANGHVYYPFINCRRYMALGGPVPDNDLLDEDNTIEYREFKPAIRVLKIIEAIEARYNVQFSRDFFDRAPFYNLFMWMHRTSDFMRSYGNTLEVDIETAGGLPDNAVSVNTANNSITYVRSAMGGDVKNKIMFKVTPQAGYENVIYTVIITNNGQEVVREEFADGGTNSIWYDDGPEPPATNTLKFYIIATAAFSFNCRIQSRVKFPFGQQDRGVNTPVQFEGGSVKFSQQVPKMKVQDFFNSLISMFNLVILPNGSSGFYIDTLDAWYDKGTVWDVTRYVDTTENDVKRPDVKKFIGFVYQKAGSALALAFAEAYGIGYGDLKATFNISGNNLKIESKFETMMFERMQNRDDGELSDIQAGYAIDKNLAPYCGAPFLFYRNGYTTAPTGATIQPATELDYIWHTATEDNIDGGQVTNALTFGSDNSTYLYTPQMRSLFSNWWAKYIEELYDTKTRVYEEKMTLPLAVIVKLKLNDRLKIKDAKYKISGMKMNLVNGEASCQLFTDLSAPADSVEDIIPITVDSTIITVDSEQLTVDAISIHNPVTSYTINGISRTLYIGTASEESFEIAVKANTPWTVSKISNGHGTGWISTNKNTGLRSDFVRVTIARNLGLVARSVKLRFTIGADNFDLTVNQENL